MCYETLFYLIRKTIIKNVFPYTNFIQQVKPFVLSILNANQGLKKPAICAVRH